MNAKRPEPPPKRLTDCPTAREMAEAIRVSEFLNPELASIVRRMAFQIDNAHNRFIHPTSPPPPRKK